MIGSNEPHAFDADELTREALAAFAPTEFFVPPGRALWLGRARNAAGAGSLGRAAPLGVFASRASPADRTRACLDDSAITHFDPRSQLACAAFNGALS